jgi:hypothetical protein
MSSVAVKGDSVFVACQRLKSFQPADTSCIAIISTMTNSVVGSVKLINKNPVSMSIFGNILYVSCAGNAWSTPTDGGIERIDLATGQNLGVLVSEPVLGGDMGTILVTSASQGYAVVSLSFTQNAVIPFNPATGVKSTAILGIDNAFGGIVSAGKYLYVGDRSLTAPGVVVIDMMTNLKTAGPLNVGIAPNSLAYLRIQE